MPNAEVIRAQTTPEDGALFAGSGLKNSKWIPQNHIAFSEDLRQIARVEIPDTRTGTQIIIPIEKTSTLVEDFEFQFLLPALTLAGGATYSRYVDYVALALVPSVKWSYVANTLQQYPLDSTFCEVKLMLDEERYNEDQLLGGNLSPAARNTFAAAPYKLRVKIPAPWNGKMCQAPCISALASKLTLTLDIAQSSYLVQTDGTKPASLTLTECELIYQQVHFTGKIRQELTSITNQPDGLSYLYDDVNRVDFDIPADYFRNTGNEFVCALTEVDGPISRMHLLLRTQDQLDPTNAGTAPYEIDPAYLDGLEYRIVSNNMDIQDPEEQNLDQLRKIQKFFKCRRDTSQAVLLWAEFPKMQNCASGNVTFGNFTNPRLFLKNPKLNGSHPALRVSVIYCRHNWLVHQRGVLQKVWR